LLKKYPREIIVQAARNIIERYRTKIKQGETELPQEYNPLIEEEIERFYGPSLVPLINGTGIILHTNLGRAPLSEIVLTQLFKLAGGYCNLEYDLKEGLRFSRHQHLQRILAWLTGAEYSLVVNNNAAAVLLAVTALSANKEVVISRGELIEIGGGFRIPEVLTQGKAILKEVGTTNKTRLKDYEQAYNPNTALFLKVHKSNFCMEGFVEEVSIEELSDLGKKLGVPVMFDLGSGAMDGLEDILPGEPTPKKALQAGADLVTFSGDKLLGGPQAGIILGKQSLLERLEIHPLMRALRPCKLTLIALESTLSLYKDKETIQQIPALYSISEPEKNILQRTEKLKQLLEPEKELSLKITQDYSKVGGGALPGLKIPTWVLQIKPKHISTNKLYQALRKSSPPILGRISDQQLILDLRTIKDKEIYPIAKAIKDIIKNYE
jgi:L-seryl-tRNA(Ser) seleniumtransferase